MPLFEGENYNDFLDLSLTEEELLFVIRNLKIKSNSGLDGINYIIIKQLSPISRHIYFFTFPIPVLWIFFV